MEAGGGDVIKFKKVPVLGVIYTLIRKPQRQVAIDMNNEHAMAYCDDLDDVIVISSELKDKPLLRTFIHEWAHAVPGSNGLNQTLDPTVAECVSVSFANALIELLSNKETRDYLFKATSVKGRR